ncbi:Cytosine/adenosine deaminase [Lentzea waywayandensis]|uniref:Cytosine/adenosine deaminase n=1 Tax=Lentzea waywayandensis TaxID=84724 RepID=A0A1I6FI34_9PSEU|nr:amidohydrolase family protein [Lentzea waywayandensis]SFR29544.1 Cytosine/adenosine deaminase [Lentzea waywayandensis]
MINRRTLTKSLGAALAVSAAGGVASAGSADTRRGRYLIRDGAVVTVDKALGVLPRADVLIDDGRILGVGPDLDARGAKIVDATGMIVLPGFVNTHHHMWSALGRNFVADGFPYFAAKRATSTLYEAKDVYRSVLLGLAELANAGVTTVHNWSNNTRSPAHADAELRAHRDGLLRARFSYGHVDQMPRDLPMDMTDVDRVRQQYFAGGTAFDGLVHLGVCVRGLSQSTEPAFFADMDAVLARGLPVAIHAGQSPPRTVDAADYERRGWLGPKTLLCHYVTALDSDMEIMVRTGTPLSWSPHSEFRLGSAGDPRDTLLRFRRAGVPVSLSSDATSIAPSDMFEAMRLVWNTGIPWAGTPSAGLPEVGFRDVLEMATLNGARALGLGDVTGSITAGKRADVILVRANDINLAPGGLFETTLVQAATAANVDTVFSDGRIIKRGGRLVAYDVDRIVRDARTSSLRIRTSAGGILTPPS